MELAAERAGATKPGATKQKVLFIGGLGRSGSTIIERLLNELPGMCAVGETIHLWERGVRNQERCGCGQPFRACEHWTAVGELAFGGWDNVDLDHLIDLRWTVDRSRRFPGILRALRRGEPTPSQREYVDHLRAVLLASAAVADQADVLLESSKHLSTAGLLANDPDLDVRILHLVRDPRGVAYSWTKEVQRPEAAKDGDVPLMPIYRPSRTAGRWVIDNLGFELLAAVDVPLLTIRYEDVLTQPAESLRTIADLAGIVSPTGQQLALPFLDGRSAVLKRTMHSIAGNPVRFGGDEVELRLDDAWKRELDLRSRLTVAAITAPVLTHFGYKFRP